MSKKELPDTFKKITEKYPEVWEAHQKLKDACKAAGPLDRKTLELVKVGICVGAGLETAAQRHALMAQENGATKEEIYQAVLVAMTIIGHPRATAGWKSVHSVLD